MTRQAAHRHLAALVVEGILVREGKGRATRYRRPQGGELRFSYPLEALAEDRVWEDVRTRTPFLKGSSGNLDHILQYALTELVNNTIDHSAGTRVDLVVFPPAPLLAFEVVDDGIGIFEKLRGALGLPDLLAALQELSKGKTTTAPERHSGEGIFFVSKIADLFLIESNGLRWQVDNLRNDTAAGTIASAPGTRVRFEVSPDKAGTLAELFAEYTRDYEFTKTRLVVKLFETGVRFISRSEAKRLLQGLERFREIVLDFHGVTDIGQGFADEVFRVWKAAHSDVALEAVHMAPAVDFMVKRASRGGT